MPLRAPRRRFWEFEAPVDAFVFGVCQRLAELVERLDNAPHLRGERLKFHVVVERQGLARAATGQPRRTTASNTRDRSTRRTLMVDPPGRAAAAVRAQFRISSFGILGVLMF